MQSYQLGFRVDERGRHLANGKAYFYLTSTTTLEPVFADAALSQVLSNPVRADSNGFFPELVYLDSTKTYRCVIATSEDEVVSEADPINTPEGTTGIGTADIQDEAVTDAKLAPGAIEAKLGYTPQADLSSLSPHAFNVLLRRVGTIFPHMSATPPAGALLLNGGTIGNVGSGASRLANADAFELFAMLWTWNAADSAILTSAGAASSRGDDAASDFAALKRLTMPDLRSEFIRGLDLSRGINTQRIGQWKDGQMPAHTHNMGGLFQYSNGGQDGVQQGGSGISTGSAGGTDSGSENRPRAITFPYCVWY